MSASAWWESFFDADYVQIWGPRFTAGEEEAAALWVPRYGARRSDRAPDPLVADLVVGGDEADARRLDAGLAFHLEAAPPRAP